MEPSRALIRYRRTGPCAASTNAPSSSAQSVSPIFILILLPEHRPHLHVARAATSAAAHDFAVLGHASADVRSLHDARFAADSVIPAFIALSYFNVTSHPFRLLLWHPSNLHNPATPPPDPSLARARAVASSPWLTPLTHLPILAADDLPAPECFSHVLVGHESAFRVTPESDAVRGVALRQLRNAVLRHHNIHTNPASSVLIINVYTHSSAAEAAAPRLDCARFAELLEEFASSQASLHCVIVDAMNSFSALAHAISSAHLHIIPSDLPCAPMLLLARESAVVFVVHATGSNPEEVAAHMQLLGDLPWLQVSHVWETDKLFHAKLLEAVGDADIKAQIIAAAQG